METTAVDPDGSVTVKMTAEEAKAVAAQLAEGATRLSTEPGWRLRRLIAMVHGEPEAAS